MVQIIYKKNPKYIKITINKYIYNFIIVLAQLFINILVLVMIMLIHDNYSSFIFLLLFFVYMYIDRYISIWKIEFILNRDTFYIYINI